MNKRKSKIPVIAIKGSSAVINFTTLRLTSVQKVVTTVQKKCEEIL